MSQYVFDDTTDLFNNFLNTILAVKGADADSDLIEKLSEIAGLLKARFKNEQRDELAVKFKQSPKLFDICLWGKKDEKELIPLFEKILNSKEPPAIALATFLNKKEGYLFVKDYLKSNLSQSKDLNLFFSEIQIEVLEKLNFKNKFERIGVLVNFSLSNLFVDTLIEASNNNIVDRQKLVNFIVEKIENTETDVTIALNNQSFRDASAEIGLNGSETNLNANTNKSGNKPDSFHIDFKNKKFHFIQCSSNPDLSSQGLSFYKHFLSLLKLTRSPFNKDGSNNIYYGFENHPAFLVNGLFSYEVDKDGKIDIVGRDCKTAMSDLTPNEINALGQTTFFQMLNNVSTPDQILILFLHNPIITGIDTLDLHDDLTLEILDVLKNHPENEEKYKEVLEKCLMKTLDVLETSFNAFPKTKFSGELASTVTLNLLKNFDSMTRNMHMKFHNVLGPINGPIYNKMQQVSYAYENFKLHSETNLLFHENKLETAFANIKSNMHWFDNLNSTYQMIANFKINKPNDFIEIKDTILFNHMSGPQNLSWKNNKINSLSLSPLADIIQKSLSSLLLLKNGKQSEQVKYIKYAIEVLKNAKLENINGVARITINTDKTHEDFGIEKFYSPIFNNVIYPMLKTSGYSGISEILKEAKFLITDDKKFIYHGDITVNQVEKLMIKHCSPAFEQFKSQFTQSLPKKTI